MPFKMDALKDHHPDLLQTLQDMVDEGKTYEQISETLQTSYPSVTRGLSARSVRRFCASYGITKKKGADLDLIVAHSVSEVSENSKRVDLVSCFPVCIWKCEGVL